MAKFKFIFTLIICIKCINAFSQNRIVTFKINTSLGRTTIDSSIYGLNEFNIDQTIKSGLNITTRRLGGNRLSTYNWENNASNSPACSNDDYLLNTAYPISSSLHNQPGILFTSFHDSSLAYNRKSLLTIQMMGYVSRDKNGSLTTSQYAPSNNRLCNVLPFKPIGVPSINLSDSTVYIDDLVGFLSGKYGKTAQNSNAITHYALDNEPDFWSGVHTCLHPSKPTCSELLNKTISNSRAIKGKDSLSIIFAGVYTWLTHNNFNYASDWSAINSGNIYKRFTGWFLKSLKDSSSTNYPKLIDVLDMHYYSKAQGLDYSGAYQIVSSGPNDKGVSIARMQAPRSLWDSSFVENSSYSTKNANQPLILIPELQSLIDYYYPGIKISFSEYNFGGGDHISGGIAHTDFLGICAKYGIYWANFWNTTPSPTAPNYHYSAFKIFRNYDGNLSRFGNEMVKADSYNSSQIQNDTLSSVYTSIDTKDTTKLHVIIINKDYNTSINGQFQINSLNKFTQAEIWKFDSLDYTIKQLPSINSISSNTFQYTIPPLTVIHMVLSNNTTTGLIDQSGSNDNFSYIIYPVPFKDEITIKSNCNQNFDFDLFDIQGHRVSSGKNLDGALSYTIKFNENNPKGLYLMKVYNNQSGIFKTYKIIKTE